MSDQANAETTMRGVIASDGANTVWIRVPCAREILGKWFAVDRIRIDAGPDGTAQITMQKTNPTGTY